jgi:hypothetical protein
MDVNFYENKKNSFCIDECVKSNAHEFSSFEKQCINTCLTNMDNALNLAFKLEGFETNKE